MAGVKKDREFKTNLNKTNALVFQVPQFVT